ncbi:hypothetical protein PLEOSDRAFT_1074969 [Pleurotus ostreatus PC15]|uniref:Ribosome biogenesis protein SLX9 n=1 Tax=Pleurotus ostreatus (strain PC15) TaxID=1137138 RepID=A0A067NRI5_PLEO1|nr:hypothetical protein PLEOSDRAFT_1074969 [Pleurotus ostreatus PC15]
MDTNPLPSTLPKGTAKLEFKYANFQNFIARHGLPPLTIRETIKLASVFCIFWFIANWSVNAALEYTSVASATILSSMSGFFTLAIGRIFRVETFTMAKVWDSLALLSAVFYALYVILLKVRIKSESRIDMQLFFGFMFITWSSDYIYVLAMLKTTPLVVTVGLSLTIPLAVVGDFFLAKPTKGQVIVGAILPKDRRKRLGGHSPSAKIDVSKRRFVADGPTEQASEILQLGDATDKPPSFTKREKQQLKHEAFLQRLESAQTPYSKSHNRRMKRKAKEQVAGGLSSMHEAISIMAEEAGLPQDDLKADSLSTVQPARAKSGQIGQGKSVPLSNAQRKRALELEKLRQPLILSTPQFAASPFQTIRQHATNSLLKHQVPS